LLRNTTGTQNVAIGKTALSYNTTASNNTAVGYASLGTNTTASYNTAVGNQALYTANRTADANGFNTAVGHQAGYSGTTAQYNSFLGQSSGYYMTTGSKNTIIGCYTGNFGGLDIRTSSNNIVLSDGDGNPRGVFNSSGNLLVGTTAELSVAPKISVESTNYVMGVSSTNATGELIRFYGNSRTVAGSISHSGSSVAYNTSSDYRLKENVVGMSGATERLKQLKPSRFNFIADADTTVDGFLAHEVQDIVPEAITGTKDAVDADGNPDYQGIDQSKLVPLLVATIQELEARIAALES
jgi:hypothetical protein